MSHNSKCVRILRILGIACVFSLTACSSGGESSQSESSQSESGSDSEVSQSNEAPSEVPAELLPLVEAFSSKTFAPWAAASSVFSPGSVGAEKWATLMRLQKNIIQEGDVAPLTYWTTEEREKWTVLLFCSEALEDGECSEYDESPEVHVTLDGGVATDLRWFQDEGDGLVEASFFSVKSSNSDFLAADFSMNSGLTIVDWTGSEKSCLFGELKISADLVASVEEVWFSAYSDMQAETVDGVTVEAVLGSTGIIETRDVLEPIPYVACFEYPLESITSLRYAAGELRFTIFGKRQTNTDDVIISLNVAQI